ncbi:SDR family oxidoreductase [Streptomyces sp. LN785]|uniref:SDR family oxidoreductase n=1 Tax=Streptomyces sp. LN785 TaxID=3112983 RepID=UPI0037196F9A
MSQRTALVVGGTSGIGLATARLLHRRGTTVHVAGRSEDRLDAVATTDPELTGHRADAGNAEEIGELIESIGTIDWLVLTLSGSDGIGPVAELDLEVLRGAFDAKFWAHLTTIKAALPHLAKNGSITLLGAITARAGLPGTSGVAALNGAVESLVKPLATELAPVRVNGVSPGVVDTPWWNGIPDEARQAYFAQVAAVLPAGRVATAEDIAEVVVLAATNANTTGTVIESDGGARLVSLA